MKLPRLILTACFALLFSGLNAEIIWTEVVPGVWKGTVGTPEDYTLLTAAGREPALDGFTRLPEVTLPELANHIEGEVYDGKTSLTIPLTRNEQIYGLGLNFQNVHQRGKILNLHVDHFGGKDTGRNHAPVPFYVSSAGYGVLINSARYMTVYTGTAVRKDSSEPPVAKDRNTDRSWTSRPYSDNVTVSVPAGGVEIYLIAGPTPMDVVRRYNLLCGGGTLPPRWGLGFTQRTQTKYTTEKVEREAEEFERRGYPLDFIGLEPGWQSKAYPCTFEWDSTRFANPESFVKRMLERKIRLNLWTNPYISPDSRLYASMYPHSGSHTVWCGIVPDLTDSVARALIKEKFDREHLSIGVSGYKIDEVDGYDHYLWPDVARFPSGTPAEQMRQTYGLMVQRLTDEMFRERNQRTFGLVRASNAGASPFPYVLYNDYYKHEDFITALINSGFCGVLWTPEVRGSKDSEEWLRRIQSVVFSPMAMINAWSSGTKPWSFPDVEEYVKEYSLLRMRMMPYWYTEFARYHFDGIPPFRAMNLEPGFNPESVGEKVLLTGNLEDNPYLEAVSKEIKDQYMAGENLLVAPMFAGQTSRKVVLPEGDWYDFYTGEYVGNAQTIETTPGLEKIPVYVKDGAIIPMMEARLHAPAAGEKVDLEIRHYGKKDGHYRLYDDDGETFDYEKGIYSWRDIKVERQKNGKLKGTLSAAPKNMPDNIGRVTWKFMTE
ncbi:MAG: DUF5110 domain-containing protein [Duncaniella sp.]|nr:DUF5110 domain-containing protein [Duncaniella sp.]